MPFCPSCRSEYTDAASVCVDCGAELVDVLAPRAGDRDVRLVDVYVAQGEVDAQLVRSILEANSIDCMLSGEAVRFTHGLTIDGLAQVTVRVRESDAVHARDVLSQSDDPRVREAARGEGGDGVRRVTFRATESSGDVSGILMRPDDAWALYVLAHGAGAGMEHRFMDRVAHDLFDAGLATFRYQFPYMEAGEAGGAVRKRPDPPALAQATVRSAVETAARLAPDLPLVAGGKSFGGRMTSSAAAAEALGGVLGIAFLGFPLHAPNRPGDARAAHLDDVAVPMLFIQGTRDALAELDLVRAVTDRLGTRATLAVVDGGDHSFNVLKRSGRTPDEVAAQIRDAVVAWTRSVVAS